MKFQPTILLKSRKDLVSALKKRKQPSSIPRLNFFEDEGVINLPKYGMKRGLNGFDRLYTESEIEAAVLNVESYSNSKTKRTFGNK